MLSVRFAVGVSLFLASAGADKRGPKTPFPLVEYAGIQPAIRKRVSAGAPAGAGSYWKHRYTVKVVDSPWRPRHTMRQIAATGCYNKSPHVTCENHRRCDRILSLRSVAQIQTGLNLCDISQRQTKRKRLVTAAVQTRRFVAAICHIVCLGLECEKYIGSLLDCLANKARKTW